MVFIFEDLTIATIALACMYVCLSFYVGKKLLWLQNTGGTPDLNTRKLFVMTCLLTSILRFMSFASMAVLDLNRVHYSVHSSGPQQKDDDSSRNEQFFEKSLLVLFDFPDFCCISAYILLMVVWGEAYLKSRRHWLSSIKFRRVWILGYLIFNVLLYASQISLYSLLFLPAIDKDVLINLIYLTQTGFNLILPIIWLIVFIYLSIQFSGFPFSSKDAKLRLKRLSHLGGIWTLSRLGWGFIALTSVIQGWLNQVQKSVLWYTIMLIVIFGATEVIPIWFSLQNSTLQSLADKENISSEQSVQINNSAMNGISPDRSAYSQLYSPSTIGDEEDFASIESQIPERRRSSSFEDDILTSLLKNNSKQIDPNFINYSSNITTPSPPTKKSKWPFPISLFWKSSSPVDDKQYVAKDIAAITSVHGSNKRNSKRKNSSNQNNHQSFSSEYQQLFGRGRQHLIWNENDNNEEKFQNTNNNDVNNNNNNNNNNNSFDSLSSLEGGGYNTASEFSVGVSKDYEENEQSKRNKNNSSKLSSNHHNNNHLRTSFSDEVYDNST
eukprot:gene9630-12966_t